MQAIAIIEIVKKATPVTFTIGSRMGLQYEKNERKEYISTVIFSPFRRMIEHRH